MSAQDVERHRRIYRAINGRDVDALIALCDPNIEVRSTFAAVSGASYRGHDGVRRWQRDLEEAWGSFHVEPEVYFDLGEKTLCLGELRGRGGQSGADVAMPAIGLASWREGLCLSHLGYLRKEDALAALGVSEEELEPIPA